MLATCHIRMRHIRRVINKSFDIWLSNVTSHRLAAAPLQLERLIPPPRNLCNFRFITNTCHLARHLPVMTRMNQSWHEARGMRRGFSPGAAARHSQSEPIKICAQIWFFLQKFWLSLLWVFPFFCRLSPLGPGSAQPEKKMEKPRAKSDEWRVKTHDMSIKTCCCIIKKNRGKNGKFLTKTKKQTSRISKSIHYTHS